MNTPALKDWPLWEIFVRSKQGLEHKHCGRPRRCTWHAMSIPADRKA